MAVQTYTKTGSKSTTPAKLDKSIFGLDVKNHQLLKDFYVTYQANQRASTAKTKHRGEVSGGGIKPWRQKGTGRARFGSSRNPIWRGGGSAFGPTGTQNPSRKFNKKAKQLALKQALSLAAKQDKLKVIESISSTSGKSSEIQAFIKKIEAPGSTLLVVDTKDDMLNRAVRNLAAVSHVNSDKLNSIDVMDADHIVLTKGALEGLSSRLVMAKEADK